MIKINAFLEIKRTQPVDTIAVLGNAPTALNYPIGAMIDDADIVVRMNDYTLKEEYAPFIGRKTDVFAVHFFPPMMNKRLDDLKKDNVKMIWSVLPFAPYKDRWPEDIKNGEKLFAPYDIYTPSLFSFFMAAPKNDLHRLGRYLSFKILGKRIFDIVNYRWAVPSGGLMSIVNALQFKPKRLIISGFNFFSSSKVHYYNKTDDAPKITHHEYHHEPVVIHRLIKRNPKIKFILALDDSLHEEMQKMRFFSNVEFIDPIIKG